MKFKYRARIELSCTPAKASGAQRCYYVGISPYAAMCKIPYFAKHELGGISYVRYAFVILKIAQTGRKSSI